MSSFRFQILILSFILNFSLLLCVKCKPYIDRSGKQFCPVYDPDDCPPSAKYIPVDCKVISRKIRNPCVKFDCTVTTTISTSSSVSTTLSSTTQQISKKPILTTTSQPTTSITRSSTAFTSIKREEIAKSFQGKRLDNSKILETVTPIDSYKNNFEKIDRDSEKGNQSAYNLTFFILGAAFAILLILSITFYCRHRHKLDLQNQREQNNRGFNTPRSYDNMSRQNPIAAESLTNSRVSSRGNNERPADNILPHNFTDASSFKNSEATSIKRPYETVCAALSLAKKLESSTSAINSTNRQPTRMAPQPSKSLSVPCTSVSSKPNAPARPPLPYLKPKAIRPSISKPCPKRYKFDDAELPKPVASISPLPGCLSSSRSKFDDTELPKPVESISLPLPSCPSLSSFNTSSPLPNCSLTYGFKPIKTEFGSPAVSPILASSDASREMKSESTIEVTDESTILISSGDEDETLNDTFCSVKSNLSSSERTVIEISESDTSKENVNSETVFKISESDTSYESLEDVNSSRVKRLAAGSNVSVCQEISDNNLPGCSSWSTVQRKKKKTLTVRGYDVKVEIEVDDNSDVEANREVSAITDKSSMKTGTAVTKFYTPSPDVSASPNSPSKIFKTLTKCPSGIVHDVDDSTRDDADFRVWDSLPDKDDSRGSEYFENDDVERRVSHRLSKGKAPKEYGERFYY